MDIHTVDSDTFSVEDVVKAHMQDLAVEKRFGVKQLKYWVNEVDKTIFCLMKGPDVDSCNNVHKESHGLTACNIIEVSDDEYHLFLGVGDKNEVDLAQKLSGDIDEGYRTILLLNHFDFTGKYNLLIKEELALIEKNQGTVILEPDKDIMVSFVSAARAINCARSMAELLKRCADKYEFRIGLVTGSPVDEEGTKIFGETKKKVKQLCLIGTNRLIYIDERTNLISSKEGSTDILEDESFRILSAEDFSFLNSMLPKIKDNLSDVNFSVDKLNGSLGLSKSQAYRKIKALTGLATNKLIQEIRLRYALKALINRNTTVAEIGYSLGFNSPAYFTRAFHKRFGLSPTIYTRFSRAT